MALFWFSGSIAWAKAISDIQSYTNPDNLIGSLPKACPSPVTSYCKPLVYPSYGSIVISCVCYITILFRVGIPHSSLNLNIFVSLPKELTLSRKHTILKALLYALNGAQNVQKKSSFNLEFKIFGLYSLDSII